MLPSGHPPETKRSKCFLRVCFSPTSFLSMATLQPTAESPTHTRSDHHTDWGTHAVVRKGCYTSHQRSDTDKSLGVWGSASAHVPEP